MHQTVQAIGQEDRIGAGFRQVGGRAHSHADVGGGQYRHVVNPVTEHQYPATLAVQLLQGGKLVGWGQTAAGVSDAKLGGHLRHHRRAVAGQQQDLPAPLTAGIDQGWGIAAQTVIEHQPGERGALVTE